MRLIADNMLLFFLMEDSLIIIKFFINEKQCHPMSRGQLGGTLHHASQNGLQLVKYLIDECHTDQSFMSG